MFEPIQAKCGFCGKTYMSNVQHVRSDECDRDVQVQRAQKVMTMKSVLLLPKPQPKEKK